MPATLIDLFIPFASCPCSPGRNDPKAERLDQDLLDLKAERPELAYRVYALNTHFAQFKANPQVAEILRDQGHDSLPLVFIDQVLRFKGVYPSRQELAAALDDSLRG